MWDVTLPIVGRCPECGEDLGGAIRIWATPKWITRYHADDRLRRGIDRSVERRILDQHERACAGRVRQRAAYAATA